MNKPLMFTILVGLALAGGSWLLVAKGGNVIEGSGLTKSSDAIDWDVGYPKNRIDPALEATAMHGISGGGKVFMTATCNPSAIAIDFEYHARDDSVSAYETQGTGQYVHIPFRVDQDEVQEAVSRTNYKNAADVVFSYEIIDPNAQMTAGDAAVAGTAALIKDLAPGLAPQDLRAFLHAREVKFELPLGDGTTEIVSVYPQDSSFQQFVAACNINLKRIDDDAARQKAAEQAANQAKADADASEARDQKEKEQQQAEYDAAKQDENNVRNACILGGRNLRVTIAALLGTADAPGDSTSPRAAAGQVVTTVANNDSTRLNGSTCEVEYSDGGNDVRGFLPWTILEPADSGETPAPAGN